MKSNDNKPTRFPKLTFKNLIVSATVFFAMHLSAFADEQPLIYVINIDVMPPFKSEAGALLKTYQSKAIKEKGAKRIELLQRLEHGNHYALVEEWATQADYDAHVSAKDSRDFRTKLQPMLGSPFDERVHHKFD